MVPVEERARIYKVLRLSEAMSTLSPFFRCNSPGLAPTPLRSFAGGTSHFPLAPSGATLTLVTLLRVASLANGQGEPEANRDVRDCSDFPSRPIPTRRSHASVEV